METQEQIISAETVPMIGDANNNIRVLANRLTAHLAEQDIIEEKLEAAKKLVKDAQDELLRLMKNAELDNFKNSAGILFYINIATRASVKDSEKAFAFLRDNGHGALIKETVNASSLSSHIKELISNGDLMLQEFEEKGIAVYTDETVRVKGRKTK